MKNFIRLAIIVWVFFTIIFLIESYPHMLYNDHIEIARRVQCETSQQIIYKALLEYHKSFNRLPSELDTLCDEGYLAEEYICCPMNPRRFFLQKPYPKVKYEYYPENFGDPNLPILSEPVTIHWGEGLRLRKLQPIIHQIMGDGKKNEIVPKISDKEQR